MHSSALASKALCPKCSGTSISRIYVCACAYVCVCVCVRVRIHARCRKLFAVCIMQICFLHNLHYANHSHYANICKISYYTIWCIRMVKYLQKTKKVCETKNLYLSLPYQTKPVSRPFPAVPRAFYDR